MPGPPNFIRVPAAPCVVLGGGPSPGNAAGHSWGGAARHRGHVAWLKYGACMRAVPRGGKDGEDAGWRQQPLQDTSSPPMM